MAGRTWLLLSPTMGKLSAVCDNADDWCAQVAQSVEHVLGKDEVSGSIPLLGLANDWLRLVSQLGTQIYDWTANQLGGRDE